MTAASESERIKAYETAEKVVLKLQRWSIKKFYVLFEQFGKVAEAIEFDVKHHAVRNGGLRGGRNGGGLAEPGGGGRGAVVVLVDLGFQAAGGIRGGRGK